MKKRVVICTALLVISLVFGGCGVKKEKEVNKSTNKLSITEGVSAESETIESETIETELLIPEMSQNNTQESVEKETTIQPTDTENTTVKVESRVLTDDEISFFTEYIQQIETAPFLLSSYTRPEEIDLNKLFYNGIRGSSNNFVTEEERTRYLEVCEESYVADIFPVRRTEADAYLQKYMGINLSQVYNQLTWDYFPEYDTYYTMVGDVLAESYTCNGGWIEGDRIHLECSFGTKSTLVTLQKKDDCYLFVGNQRGEN